MSPGRLDRSVVHRHLVALDTTLQELRKHQGQPASALEGSLEPLWVVERGLQLCCQNALDLALHVAASAGRDVVDYAGAIDAMSELGILPPDFAHAFRGIAGLRNGLVHGYLGLDRAILHRVLNERLDDFGVFAQHVRRHTG
jgi:uncharacterized protein YutE (UPF0331/DUF86 family)